MAVSAIAPPQPHLVDIYEHLYPRADAVEQWLGRQFEITPPPFYSSVDVRASAYKVAPVDTNLFPAGFNNLCEQDHDDVIEAIRGYFDRYHQGTQCVGIIPEMHTRNEGYKQHLSTLVALLQEVGVEVILGTWQQDFLDQWQGREPMELLSADKDGICFGERMPDVILLNNDLSEGSPSFLIENQRVIPSGKLGWTHRLKSHHFSYYFQVVEDFCAQFSVQSSHLMALMLRAHGIDFGNKLSLDRLKGDVELLFSKMAHEYQQYQVDQPPFCFIKSNAGTYGLGVFRCDGVESIDQMNRKVRGNMNRGKGGATHQDFILQEGIPTVITHTESQSPAESVYYLIGAEIVGQFYRFHTGKSGQDSLNAKGMGFIPRCKKMADIPVYGFLQALVARLANLAASREMAEVLAP